MTNKKLITAVVVLALICAAIAFCAYQIKSDTRASDISKEDAQVLVNEQFDAAAVTKALKHIASVNDITVNNMEYGSQKDIILACTVKTVDAYGVISPQYDEYLDSDAKKKNSSMFKSSLDFKMEYEKEILAALENADIIEKKVEITLYDTDAGFVVYTDEKALNEVFGGTIDIKKDVENKKEVTVTDENGNKKTQPIASTNVNKGFIECFETRVSTDKPDTSGFFGRTWNNIKEDFHINFIKHNRWKTIFKGLWVTIKLTFFSLIIGIILGFLVAFVRCTYLKSSKRGVVLKILNGICQTYLTVVRGTPAVVQIMIIYFVIFMPMGVDKFLAAVVCFGFNSGAYVAEIVRGGIMSVDDGQIEAGRSLGFNYMQTMGYIVFPQAFKAVLPSLANEFVVLLKETSVAFYIGLGDLMYAGNAIRSATYSAFMPLIAVALIYLVMVLGLSKLVGILERRLRSNER